MYQSKYYTGEEIDQRLLQGYYDDFVAKGYTGSKDQFLNTLKDLIMVREEGKILSTNDFTDELKSKLEKISPDDLNELIDRLYKEGIPQVTYRDLIDKLTILYSPNDGTDMIVLTLLEKASSSGTELQFLQKDKPGEGTPFTMEVSIEPNMYDNICTNIHLVDGYKGTIYKVSYGEADVPVDKPLPYSYDYSIEGGNLDLNLDLTPTDIGDILLLKSGKVDKVEGKGLSTNDFTNSDKQKLENLTQSPWDKIRDGVVVGNANNVVDEEISHAFASGVNGHVTGYAGTVEGNATTAGLYAHAEGNTTQATGETSHAEGNQTLASGKASHVEGIYSKARGETSHAEGTNNEANGGASHAEGKETIATGNYAHSEGYKTKAQGNASHAEGKETIATGVTAHAEGYNTQATGDYSHAEGNSTIARGSSSHAEGSQTETKGINSHAEGNSTIARGSSSHAEGSQTETKGINSHAEGVGSKTLSGDGSHAEGGYTETNNDYEHAEGYGNKSNTEAGVPFGSPNRTIHSVGIGSPQNRKNAHEIMQNGDHYIIGIGGYDGTNFSEAQTLQEIINNLIGRATINTLPSHVDEVTLEEMATRLGITQAEVEVIFNGGCRELYIADGYNTYISRIYYDAVNHQAIYGVLSTGFGLRIETEVDITTNKYILRMEEV